MSHLHLTVHHEVYETINGLLLEEETPTGRFAEGFLRILPTSAHERRLMADELEAAALYTAGKAGVWAAVYGADVHLSVGGHMVYFAFHGNRYVSRFRTFSFPARDLDRLAEIPPPSLAGAPLPVAAAAT